MKNYRHKIQLSWQSLALLFGLFLFTISSGIAQRLPYEILNNSEFPDNEVFVAVVGEELPGGKFIWMDAATGQINRMSQSDNTVPGPIINGNRGPGLDGRYANCFRRLSEIPNKTLQIPQIAGCRILISFKSQLYLYFFGYDSDPRGYAGANLENETDPNQGITFEVIELTYNEFGIFNNTSRVDAFQYPIGLEVEGVDFFKKVGELKSREEIFNRWEQTAPPAFRGLLDRKKGIISFPTKNESFPKDYLNGYIDAIWSKYRTDEIYFNSGDAGRWRGRVQGNNFVFRRESDGQVATIPGKPTTLEAMEGSGIMAQGPRWDLVVQAQFVAAITRHAIDLNTASGQFQDFGDASKYYQTEPYNWYAKFLHQTDISFEGQTYAFAYDDVFDQSATISTGNPIRAKITLGTINGDVVNPPIPTDFLQIEAEDFIAQNGIQTEPASEGGLNVGFTDPGDWIAYGNITFPNSGTYTIEYRVASAVGGGVISADLNAGAILLGEIAVPNTGGWQNWRTVSQTVTVNAGTYPFGLFSKAGGWNLNWIRISGGVNKNSEIVVTEVPLTVYPNPATNQIKVNGVLEGNTLKVYNSVGQIVKEIRNQPSGNVQVNIAALAPGLYFLKNQNESQIVKFIKK